ncbi:DUF4148 domain-containing protein [Noviherbaspirillum sp. CPCC 100848]|uniref:DUF4148 domain-containing protein n=1 Tax=Noviherbaspirillum album TaxID=3080276 RepID=A0ABU6JIJ4_9BURK|nr:DUF4148 domain-containing protein [Noviherbaspirillum sp. CPCC 100848]MEC4722894.1 DUF4148 domain-containing protein [Noviherbaspirillum sp. CPCC 100848]
MKKKLLFAIAKLVMIAGVSSSALADDKWLGNRGSNWEDHVKSTKSRAEVRAELEEARRNGTLQVSNGAFYPQAPQAPQAYQGRSRAEVRAEAVQANRQGNEIFDSIYFGS